MAKILVVEDNLGELRTLVLTLGRKHEVVPVMRLAEAREKLDAYTFDLVVVDLGLPDGNGLDLVGELHDERFGLPILILSGRGSDGRERSMGLRSGADDYLAKPHNVEELDLRVESLLSKQKIAREEVLKWGSFYYYPTQHRVTIGEEVKDRAGIMIRAARGDYFERILPNREAKLLECLMRRAGQIVSREQIYEFVWQRTGENEVEMRTIDVVLRRLRKALGGEYREWVRSVRGVGYQLKIE